MAGKYVAYVGSYTYIGNSEGITIFDVDPEKGCFQRRGEMKFNNASYLALSPKKDYLYAVVDEGIVTFRILPDGGLDYVNSATIRGMRGCYMDTDKENRYIFVAGSHDGKVTVLRVRPEGGAGEITDSVFHEGLGSVAERSYRPHVSCVRLTPDEKYLCAVDVGVDQIKVYAFNKKTGKIRLKDIIRCELDSGPRHMIFSQDGKYAYVVSELHNNVTVYTYDGTGEDPKFEIVQKVSTLGEIRSTRSAASSIMLSEDQKHLFCTNAGDNSVCMYDRDVSTGLLTQRFVLPVSGDYPKDCGLFPGGKELYSVNHAADTITFFRVDYEKGLIIMNQAPEPVDEPNKAVIVKLPD